MASRLPHQAAPAAEEASRRPVGKTLPEDPPLIRMLVKEAQRRGHQMQEMSKALDCTYGYIAQLRCGSRLPEHIGDGFARNAANYLGVPSALVKVIAGRLTLRDFAWPQRDPEKDVAACLESLRDDPVVGAFVPQELFEADPAVQQFVWQLYSECADRHPTTSRSLPRALEYLQRAALNEAEFEAHLAQLRDEMARPNQRLDD